MKDMTQGPEGKLILWFTLPMLAGNIFQQMYNLGSSNIVGRYLGKTALGAMGSSFSVFFLMISLVMGITMGATVVISQYYGAKDIDKVKRTINTTYIFLFFLSIAVSIAGVIFCGDLLKLIHAPVDTFSQAKIYLIIFFAGSIFLFGYNTISAVLRGLGDSKTPLYFLIISSILNIILVFVFIVTFRWGIAGAAWATVISQGVSFFLGQYYLERTQHGIFKIRWNALFLIGKFLGKS
jgi:putative MATE family efflux protein